MPPLQSEICLEVKDYVNLYANIISQGNPSLSKLDSVNNKEILKHKMYLIKMSKQTDERPSDIRSLSIKVQLK